MAQGKPDERAARVWIGVWGALAGEVRQKRDPLGARFPRGRLLVQGAERRVGDPPEPPERPGGGEHHAHRMPGARHRMAEHVGPAQRIRAVAGKRREDDAGGPEHDGRQARLVHADPDCAGRLVTGAADLGRLAHRRQPLGRDLERREHLLAPPAAGDVEQERPGRVRGVRRQLAEEPEPDVVLRQQHVGDPLVDLRLVAPEPEQLRCGEPG